MSASRPHAIIPARLAASRFPGKVLATWRERSVLEWVWRATTACEGFSSVTIATGDEAIRSVAEAFGASVHLDRAPYRNGTERAAAACRDTEGDIVVVQADQPGLQTAHLTTLLEAMHGLDGDMFTPCVPLDASDQDNMDVVKCWSDVTSGHACFSRHRPTTSAPIRRHIGIYGYREQALRQYVAAGPCEAEHTHRLEQLRSLAIGHQVQLVELNDAAPCIDRPEDIHRLKRWFSRSAP